VVDLYFMQAPARFLLLLAAMLFVLPGRAQTFEKAWDNTYAGFDVEVFTTGPGSERFAFLGTIPQAATTSNDADLVVFVTDSAGGMLWSNRYNFPGYRVSSQRGRIMRTADNGFVIYTVLYSLQNFDDDLLLMKIDSAGGASWARHFDYYKDDFADMTITPDGGFILCGNTHVSMSSVVRLVLIKTDAAGMPQWEFAYEDTFHSGKPLFADVDTCAGGYVVSGRTDISSANAPCALLARFDTTGTALWWNNYCYSGPGNIYPARVHTIRNGFALATTDNYTTALFTTDTAGTFLWAQTYKISSTLNYVGNPYDFIRTSDGGFAIAGNGPGPVSKAFLLKTDSLGTMQWSRRYQPTNSSSSVRGLRECASGGYILSGEIAGGGIYTLQTDNAGKTFCNEVVYHTIVAPDTFSTTTFLPERYSGISAEPVGVFVNALPLTDSIFCHLSSSGNDLPAGTELSIAPNPSSGIFTLQGEFSRDAKASVYDVQGKLVKQFQPAANTQFDLSAQPAGLYLLVVMDEGNRYSARLVRE
jgi:hypothetical protein